MTETGIWEQQEASQYHYFSYPLARFIGKLLPKDTILIDVGCGNGRYLDYFDSIGFWKLKGIEGVNLEINEFKNKSEMYTHDLSQPIQFKIDKGNVLCLEVGEHIPKEYETVFLNNLCSLVGSGCTLIMSWAIIGQEGIGHVNCKPTVWVLNELKKRGFELLLEETLNAQSVIENEASYFRNTLLILKNTK